MIQFLPMRTIIKTVADLDKNSARFYTNEPAGCDVETTGLDPLIANIRTLQLSHGEDTIVIDFKEVPYEAGTKFLKPILENSEKSIGFHNAKFDCGFIKHHLNIDTNRIFDSYLTSVILEAGIRQQRGYHGLESVLKRFTGLDIEKDEQKSDWSGELTQSQYDYAAKDAEVMLPLRLESIEKLRRAGLMRCAQLEFEAILPIAWLELCGIYLDFDQWGELAKNNSQKANEVAEEIYDILAPVIPQASLFGNGSINLNSPKQVQEYFRAFGIPMPDSTKEIFLEPLAGKYPIIAKLLEYKGLAKSVSSFGENWEEFINPVTGRIHPSFSQIGAATGRMSCSSPNMQQIKQDNAFRNCFRAEGGNTFVSADYANIELRILADFARDKTAIEAFAGGRDFHQAMAGILFNKPIDQVLKSERKLAKTVNFAIPYGAGPDKVAMTAGISRIEAEILMKDYFAVIPNIDKWLRKQKRDVLRTHYARTGSGRIGRFVFDENDYKQVSAAQRNAANLPIQGTSCDILKRALRLLYDGFEGIRDHVKLVNIVHDEIILEVEDAYVESASEILTTSMKKAGREYLNEVEIQADVSVSKFWNKD